jgi:hypothetical protein
MGETARRANHSLMAPPAVAVRWTIGTRRRLATTGLWGCVYSVGLGCAGVFADQTAESVSPLDGVAVCWCHELEGRWLGSGWSEFEAAVRSVGVVVVGIDAEDVLEVSAAPDQDPVQALASDGPDAAFRVSVGPRPATLPDLDSTMAPHAQADEQERG